MSSSRSSLVLGEGLPLSKEQSFLVGLGTLFAEMLVIFVGAIVLLYCYHKCAKPLWRWSSRHCCCRPCCRKSGDPESAGATSTLRASHQGLEEQQQQRAAPTIILLPHGRMLVVDGALFAQLQAERTGLDLVELGESAIRAERHHRRRSFGLEGAEEPAGKASGCFPPPTYESIYGKDDPEAPQAPEDRPPSYSDILASFRYPEAPYALELRNEAGSPLDGRKDDLELWPRRNPSIVSNPIESPRARLGPRRLSCGSLDCSLFGRSSRLSQSSLARTRSHHTHGDDEDDGHQHPRAAQNLDTLTDIRESRV